MYFVLQEQVRARLINLLTGRATNRKKRHHRDPPGPLPPGERTLPLGTQCGPHGQWGEGATEPPLSQMGCWGCARAPPEPHSLTPAQAVWPSIWPSSGDTAALSTRPELAAFSSLRGKTRAGCESTTARWCIHGPAELRGGPLWASPPSSAPSTDSVQGTDDGGDGGRAGGRPPPSLRRDPAICPAWTGAEG